MAVAPDISFASTSIEDLTMPHQVSVNALTGAATVSVPIPLTSGRRGFEPALALQYTSSGSNSTYGVGWFLSGVSSIGLSGKQLPKYDGKDEFVFNGSEELVPTLHADGQTPRWDEQGDYRIYYYRSKVEQAYIRFEQWVHQGTGQIHWRTRTPNNVVSIYGLAETGTSRIAHPADDPAIAQRTYLWLVEAQYDNQGNAIVYEYVPENAANVEIGDSFERNRLLKTRTFPQRYLKRIRYGNTCPLQPDTPLPIDNRWLFETVLDYGDHRNETRPTPQPDRPWPTRPDPYSDHRPGFEVRTYRLCHRVLMFHHFPELGPEPTLVGMTELSHHPDEAGTTLTEIAYTGFRNDGAAGKSLPPLRFEYSTPTVGQQFLPSPEQTTENMPDGLGDIRYRWVDLFGEGLPGILTETNQAWYYKANQGGGSFGAQTRILEKPAQLVGTYTLSDFDQDGNLNLVVLQGRQAGFYEYDRDQEQWRSFQPFSGAPHIDTLDTRAQWLDLNGDGRADILISHADRYTWYPSEGKDGFGAPIELAKPAVNGAGPPLRVAEDLALDFFFADMNGDGLLDLVRIQNGRVEYWPQLGNGHFGDSVLMADAPVFDDEAYFDPSRLRLVDLDGSGTTDILYLGRGELRYWINASGNQLLPLQRLTGLPYIDNLSSVQVLDFLGDGTACLVWSSALPGMASAPLQYLQLTNGVKPRLLLAVENGMGQRVELSYTSSGRHYLRDQLAGRGWISKLPSHSAVVDRKVVIDQIGGARLTSRYEYHDGFFDSEERLFRGFSLVEQYDTETFADWAGEPEHYTEPVCVRTWYHNGAFGWDTRRFPQYYQGDDRQAFLPAPLIEELAALKAEEYEDGIRALAGQVIRQEVFALDTAEQRAEHPYQVTQATYRLRRLQPSTEDDDACFSYYPSEQLAYTYEQQGDDPRVTHQLTLAVDAYGNVETDCAVAYPRRSSVLDRIPAQASSLLTANRNRYVNIDTLTRYELGIPIESETFELSGLRPVAAALLTWGDLHTQVAAALAVPLAVHESFAAGTVQARRVTWNRSYYWNDLRAASLPLGQVGSPTLLHHEESACFNDALLEQPLGSLVGAEMLQREGLYVLQEGYWWQPGPIYHPQGAAQFYALERVEQRDGGSTTYTYDTPYCLTAVAMEDALGNRTEAAIDYYLIAPHRITDPNGTIAEVRYDPLGLVVVSTTQGTVAGAGGTTVPYGQGRLADYTSQADASFEAILAEPQRFAQQAGQFTYYELTGTADSPLRSLDLVREEWVHDGQGGGTPEGRIQIAVTYRDGFGRTLQSKQRVEAGMAIARTATGEVDLDPEGMPREALSEERWLVSGHTVYNNKQLPVRQYEPFYSSVVTFESDRVLRTYGVSTLSHYDALGRLVRQEMPNGTFSRVETTPWEQRQYDPNDTLLEEGASGYRTIREVLPAGSPERSALRKATAHANTPSVVRLDPLGREVMQVETNEHGQQRITENRLDIQGNITTTIDPRGLTAFTYQRDMLGRVLHEHSIDAGDTWSFTNGLDQLIHQWDGKGNHQQFGFDHLGRPTTLVVTGVGMVERLAYGEDLPLAEAQRRNARGQLITHYDAAGRLTLHQYDPLGNLLHSERQLAARPSLEDPLRDPDWSDLAAVTLAADSRYESRITYDALGRVKTQQLPDGTTRTMDYLWSGGVNQVRVSTADGVWRDHPVLAAASFNARGQRTASTLGNGIEIQYAYDPETYRMNRLTATRPAQTPGDASRTYQDIEYVYDPVGNLTYLLDHAQEPATASPYVFRGLNVSSACEYTYDALYQLTQASGRVHQALLPHDDVPNLPEANAIKASRYQPLDNLAAVERYTRQYTYDLAGNLQTIRHQADSRTWNQEFWIAPGSNRSLPARDLNDLPVLNPEGHFDANGNCTALPHLRQMEWNARNQLTRAIVIDRSTEGTPSDGERYVYGSDGMRVRKVSQALVRPESPGQPQQLEITEKIYLEGCEIKRVYRNGELVLERMTSHIMDGGDTIARLHQWTRDDQQRETDDVSGHKVHYQLSNHLGSASLEVSEQGELISYEEYFPFGGTAFMAGRNMREVTLKDYRYCGKERDDVTSFYYYGYRYYVPWMGRWLSPDPIGPVDSVNLYLFVSNNPINVTDPNGLGDPPRRLGQFHPMRMPVDPSMTTRSWEARPLQQPGAGGRGEVVPPSPPLISTMNLPMISGENIIEAPQRQIHEETVEHPEQGYVNLPGIPFDIPLELAPGFGIDIDLETVLEEILSSEERSIGGEDESLNEECYAMVPLSGTPFQVEVPLGQAPSIEENMEYYWLLQESEEDETVTDEELPFLEKMTAVIVTHQANLIFNTLNRYPHEIYLEPMEIHAYVMWLASPDNQQAVENTLEDFDRIREEARPYSYGKDLQVVGRIQEEIGLFVAPDWTDFLGGAGLIAEVPGTVRRSVRAARRTADESVDVVEGAGTRLIPHRAQNLPGESGIELGEGLSFHSSPTRGGGRSGGGPPLGRRSGGGDEPLRPARRVPKAIVEAIMNEINGLTLLANRIKGLGQSGGATVEIALAELRGGERVLVAGLNSSATWTQAQLNELRRLGIQVAPQFMKRRMKRAPHAEENIAIYLSRLRARGIRWSQAVVGSGGSYVCGTCRRIIRLVGGSIEEGIR